MLENRLPNPFNTGLKVRNDELDFIWNRWGLHGIKCRIIDAGEEMRKGERCLLYAVGSFGKSVRCLIVDFGCGKPSGEPRDEFGWPVGSGDYGPGGES
jgi:hypothetical protein